MKGRQQQCHLKPRNNPDLIPPTAFCISFSLWNLTTALSSYPLKLDGVREYDMSFDMIGSREDGFPGKPPQCQWASLLYKVFIMLRRGNRLIFSFLFLCKRTNCPWNGIKAKYILKKAEFVCFSGVMANLLLWRWHLRKGTSMEKLIASDWLMVISVKYFFHY